LLSFVIQSQQSLVGKQQWPYHLQGTETSQTLLP